MINLELLIKILNVMYWLAFFVSVAAGLFLCYKKQILWGLNLMISSFLILSFLGYFIDSL